MKIYVSGKITGLLESHARALFDCGCSVVECAGHEAINPFIINEYMPNATYEELMQEDLRVIRDDADAMLMLMNWHLSSGARREYVEAVGKGIPIYFEHDISTFWHECQVATSVVGAEVEVEFEEIEEGVLI